MAYEVEETISYFVCYENLNQEDRTEYECGIDNNVKFNEQFD